MNRIVICLTIIVALGAQAATFAPANRPFDVSHYKIRMTIDPSLNESKFSADVTIRLKPTGSLTGLTLDAEDLDIRKVTLEAPSRKNLEFKVEDKHLNISLPSAARRAKELTLKIDYSGAIRPSHSGLFRVTDPDEPTRGPLLFTHLEPTGARTVFPGNDEPYDKATFETEVTVPLRYSVVSNGRLVGEKKLKRLGQPWHTLHWKQDKPQSTYLFALAIAPLHKLSVTHRDKEISAWVGETKVEKARYLLGSTKKAMEFFETQLGVDYPWAKYAIVGIPTFLWGGMENTSATFQNQERSLLNDKDSEFEKRRITGLTAHELAHQWFGDLVTMAWWDDVWLNESFATYMETRASRHIFANDQSEIDFVTDTWDSYFRQEDGPRSHPIVDKGLTGPDDAFDSINYVKGGNVLRMLNFYLGEEKFKRGVKAYLTQFRFGNASFRDFFAVMEKSAGESLTTFRDTWLTQRGYPILAYKGIWNEATSHYSLSVAQRPNHAEDKTVFRFRLPVAFHRRATPAYDKTTVLEMGLGAQPNGEVILELPAAPEWVTINPGAVVLAKVEQAERDESALVAQALGDSDTIARVWAAYTLAEDLKNGGSLSGTAERTLGEMLRSDPSPYVRIALLDSFQKMKPARLPSKLGDTVLELTRVATAKEFDTSARFLSDAHGWRQWRSRLVGTLGKVDQKEAGQLLTELLAQKALALDDLGEAAIAVAKRGEDSAPTILKNAMKLHRERGYRYLYSVQYAFGAYESPKAADEIAELAKTAAPDLLGRIGWVIRDNQALKNSPEWANVLRRFVLENDRFGDEVKARILETVEEVKTEAVKGMMEAIVKESHSDRMKELAKKILEKNFPPPTQRTAVEATRKSS